jgi:aminoglycoside phosphotransferase (APT) family kinase protein
MDVSINHSGESPRMSHSGESPRMNQWVSTCGGAHPCTGAVLNPGPQPERHGPTKVGSMSEAETSEPNPPGIRVREVTAWCVANIAGCVAPLHFTLVAGGRSNLTFRVTDAVGNVFVLRRPPLGHLLPSAHDMAREYRVISALGSTVVPVAEALGLCSDEVVTDRPFYVMSFVDGHILRTDLDADLLSISARETASQSIVDVLADLHELDVDAVGLGELGKRTGYIERQLKRWHTQFTQSKLREVPIVDDIFEKLSARIPIQQGVSIVHGDYRLDNAIVDTDGHIRAVLDWEICTLGDPLADLGLLMVYWPEDTDPNPPLGAAATTTSGFAKRSELIQRYAQRSTRDLSEINFYVAFGYWKLACILDGVYTRYRSGAMGEDGYDFSVLDEQVQSLAITASTLLETAK